MIHVTTNDNSTVTLEGELPTEALEKHRGASIKNLGASIKMDGFREGHVPENLLIERIGEYSLLQEMAQRALAEHYPLLLVEHKIDAIGRPEVAVTKLASGNPLGFRITTAILPKVELPDYTGIAKGAIAKEPKEAEAVTEEDIDKVITQLLEEKNKAENKEQKTEGETKEPELVMTDEIAKTFGPFENTAGLRAKIKEGMSADKVRQLAEKKRLAVMDAIMNATKITVPDILIDAELNKLMTQFAYDIERMGMKREDYMKTLGKTEDEMRNEFRPDAEKRAKSQLILNAVATKENIVPDAKEVAHEVEHLLSHHMPKNVKPGDKERESATIYVTTLMTNQKVLEFLEKQEA